MTWAAIEPSTAAACGWAVSTGPTRSIALLRLTSKRSEPWDCRRFHDLRHTHATLLIAAGVPIKVVSERLGHANPGFTMATYQHVLPGMGADAANRFAALIATHRDHSIEGSGDDTTPDSR